MIGDLVSRFRLGRVERKLKRMRSRQRDARQDLKRAEALHDDGDLATSEYEERREKLKDRKREITRTIKDLREKKEKLEEALDEA